MQDAYLWKPSVGPIQDRPGHYNGPWHYWSTDGTDSYLALHPVLLTGLLFNILSFDSRNLDKQNSLATTVDPGIT